MMKRHASEEDRLLLVDEQAPESSRCRAVVNIGMDLLKEYEPVLDEMLTHKSPQLRCEAASVLIGLWTLERHLDAVTLMLHHDAEPEVRFRAGVALRVYTEHSGVGQNFVLRELAKAIAGDPDPSVRDLLYEDFLRLVSGKEVPEMPDGFDPDRDAHWTPLKPYLDQN